MTFFFANLSASTICAKAVICCCFTKLQEAQKEKQEDSRVVTLNLSKIRATFHVWTRADFQNLVRGIIWRGNAEIVPLDYSLL